MIFEVLRYDITSVIIYKVFIVDSTLKKAYIIRKHIS